MVIRDASFSDLPKIVEIYNSTIPSRMVTADTEPVTVASRQNWMQQHHPSDRPLWIVENDHQKVIGWVSFQSFYGRPAYHGTAEISIYLDEIQRGKGYGKELLGYCMEQAPRFKIKVLIGFIFSHNILSLNLFQKMGFEKWGELPQIAVLDGIERSLSILDKRLDKYPSDHLIPVQPGG
ncbi:MAG: GNAT family N-acetyltransferase [Chitinophagaceae bacterium]